MPPSRHSSSHHSSSSHSSHSSSHRSSSHSSHSSSHHRSSYSSSSSSYRPPKLIKRTRTSQPYGWNTSKHGAISHYRCVTHDYDYYSNSWIAEDGRQFEEGYYDENGKHYNNVIMAGGRTMLRCTYCGNRMVYKWKEGSLPTCDKCGAQFEIDITDTPDRSNKGLPMDTMIILILVSLLGGGGLMVMIATCVAALFSNAKEMPGDDPGDTRSVVSTVHSSIYVEEIGRTCYLDGEDWYDSTTQCWFYFNDGQWQYWYEGISSDYGDYGWMEFDMGESAWYIEATEGNWVHLPSGYDTSNLWHMEDEYVNRYE